MKRGFTLVELLVVISIISILATVGLVIFSGVQLTARDAVRKRDLHNLQLALAGYYHQNGRYPCTTTDDTQLFYQSMIDSSIGGSWLTDCSTSPIPLDTTYISTQPVDPKNNIATFYKTAGEYGYSYWSGVFPAGGKCPAGQSQYYVLVARLENQNDPDTYAHKNNLNCAGDLMFGTADSNSSQLYIVTSND